VIVGTNGGPVSSGNGPNRLTPVPAAAAAAVEAGEPVVVLATTDVSDDDLAAASWFKGSDLTDRQTDRTDRQTIKPTRINTDLSPICPHCGKVKETAEHLLLFCSKCAVKRPQYFGDSINILDILQNLSFFL